MLEGDLAVLADDERLRDAVDAPVDGRAAVRIDPDRRERRAEVRQELQGLVRRVLVVEPDEVEAAVAGEAEQDRMLLAAGRAP